jgi:hypothetical protein
MNIPRSSICTRKVRMSHICKSEVLHFLVEQAGLKCGRGIGDYERVDRDLNVSPVFYHASFPYRLFLSDKRLFSKNSRSWGWCARAGRKPRDKAIKCDKRRPPRANALALCRNLKLVRRAKERAETSPSHPAGQPCSTTTKSDISI